MPTLIRNNSVEAQALPYPFRGVIPGGHGVVVNLTSAQVLTALGANPGNFQVQQLDAAYPGPFDSSYEGDAALGLAGATGAAGVAIPAGRVPYGNAGGTGVTSEAALAYNDATNTLTAGTVVGNLTGNVTGDVTGNLTGNSAGTHTGSVTGAGATSVATGTGGVTTTGDLDAAGGFRKTYGPFLQDNVAASQAAVRLALGATGNPQVDLVASRAGSLVAITASFTVAPAGSALIVSVFKNGSLLHATAILTVAPGAPLGYVQLFAKDNVNLLFVAGDRVGVAVTTDGSWTATTSDIAIGVELEG